MYSLGVMTAVATPALYGSAAAAVPAHKSANAIVIRMIRLAAIRRVLGAVDMIIISRFRVPCPRLCVGMGVGSNHAHAKPWAWHPSFVRVRHVTAGRPGACGG